MWRPTPGASRPRPGPARRHPCRARRSPSRQALLPPRQQVAAEQAEDQAKARRGPRQPGRHLPGGHRPAPLPGARRPGHRQRPGRGARGRAHPRRQADRSPRPVGGLVLERTVRPGRHRRAGRADAAGSAWPATAWSNWKPSFPRATWPASMSATPCRGHPAGRLDGRRARCAWSARRSTRRPSWATCASTCRCAATSAPGRVRPSQFHRTDPHRGDRAGNRHPL